jgi:RNA polymerase sigma-70 factor, ECF subfamily
LHRRPCDIHNYTQASPVLAAAGYRVIVVGFTVRRGRIVAINVLADPARLQRLDLDVLDD